ncbi:phage terminase large subunit [Geodermatophilus chilensis]|uniref:phage terminase large subunit n=1 Tax=Geodermatophilus chilensis TaxID=2035835 RepID=UPI0018E49ECF|nr:phage terminase large subunit [Geodermatophilus chilensis]
MAAPAWLDAAIAAFEQSPGPRWQTPGELARAINPATVQTPALDLIDTALVDVLNTPDGRLIVTMPPQEGKSTRVAGEFPTWVLTHNPETRIVVASYGQGLATRNGRAIRNRITSHPELGLSIAPDNGAVHEWTLAGHQGGVLSVGIGGGLTGRPADLMVIDDPIKDRKEADSAVYRQGVWDWWTDVASTRLAPGAPVVIILTRWHEDDLAGRLLAAEDGHLWRVLNIPAQADHMPEKGETDPLGREPGEFMLSARGRTTAQWQAIKVRSGARTWASLYQGRPAPAEGALFKRDQWARYDTPLAVERDDGSMWVPLSDGDQVAQSWDLAFKGTDGADYVVGQVWLRRGVHLYLLDQVRRRMSFTETLTAVKALSARWPQALAKFVEDKANGPAVISMLARTVPGLIPVEPEGGKVARANAASPFVEAGNVHLPTAELLPNVDDLIEEAAAFPNGAHDDAVDALTQAVNRLLISPLLFGDDTDPGDEYDDELDAEMRISLY